MNSSLRWSAALLTASTLASLSFVSSAAAQDSDPPPDEAPPVTVAPPVEEPTDEVIHSWTLAPAGSDNPDEAGNRPNLSYTGDPGSVIEDAVTLYNYGNQQLTFRIYAADAFNNETGQFDILAGDQESTDVGSWVDIPQEFVQLPPGQQITFPISVTIPDDALPGDHAGAVIAASEVESQAADGARVDVERRTGTRLYVRVNGPLQPELAIEGLATSYSPEVNPFGGSATVTYRIQNNGNVIIGGTSEVTVSGPFGIGEDALPPQQFPELLPGEGIDVTQEVDNVPAYGWLSTNVEVIPAGTDGDDAAGADSVSASSFAPPIVLLVVLIVLLLGVLVWRMMRRHRRRDEVTVLEVEHQPQLT